MNAQGRTIAIALENITGQALTLEFIDFTSEHSRRVIRYVQFSSRFGFELPLELHNLAHDTEVQLRAGS